MLIVLEGLDGAGKSTQVKMLDSYLQAAGRKTRFLHFPRYDAPIYGDLIARFLRGDFGDNDTVHPQLVALMYSLDRIDAAPIIREWLDEGCCVILDRYVYSNIAFQCAKLPAGEQSDQLREWIFNYEYEVSGIPRPDFNIFLDVPIVFVDRQLKRNRSGSDRDYLDGKRDIHEASIEFQKKVRSIYLRQCELDSDFIRIDCAAANGDMLPATAIFDNLKQIISQRLK
ncbi:MAG: dTMP kinase [Bacteroidales bacterium]|nr:dTMP kinase [Bacteroidales bacterium]